VGLFSKSFRWIQSFFELYSSPVTKIRKGPLFSHLQQNEDQKLSCHINLCKISVLTPFPLCVRFVHSLEKQLGLQINVRDCIFSLSFNRQKV